MCLPSSEVGRKGPDLGALAPARPLAGCGLSNRFPLAGLSLTISKVGDFGLIQSFNQQLFPKGLASAWHVYWKFSG